MISSRVNRFRRARACLAAAALLGSSARAAPITLDQLIARAKQMDPRVRAAQADVADLIGKRKEAFWAWFPKFETTIALAGPTPEARNDGLGGPPTTAASYEYDADLGHVGFTVRANTTALLPVYTFGKLDALRTAGNQGPIIGEALKERAEAETVQQVVEVFYGYQLARQGLSSLGEGLTRIDDAGKRIQGMLAKQSDQVSQLDVFKVDYFRQLIEAKQAQAQNGMELATQAIRMIIGVGPTEPIEVVSQDLTAPNFELKPVEEYIRLAEQFRPELRAADAGLVAKKAELFIRKREYFPDFGILGFFNFAYTSSATRQRNPFAYDPYNDLSSGLALVARMTFDIPIKSAHVDQAQAELQKLQAQRDAIAAGIRLEVAKARADLVEAQARAKAYAEAEKNARRWATAAYENFDVGVGDTRELTDAFIALGQASGEKLKAWYDAEIQLHALSRAVGVDLPNVIVGAAK